MRALLSVWDKTGITEFAARLVAAGFELISTGGTYRSIADAGIPVRSVSDVTSFPELIDGRVKTLHPAVHGGILARRDRADHLEQLAHHGIEPIDLVAGNLYPFQSVVQAPGSSLDDALEHIDIGGPAMIRAAAKNFPGVVVVVDPGDYDTVASRLQRGGLAGLDLEQRRRLAAKAFAHVSAYDSVIARYLSTGEAFPETYTMAGAKVTDLRYGENPHQRAALYRLLSPRGSVGAGAWRQLSGKEMSYNNYLDAESAISAAADFEAPTVAIVKHNTPCGLASDDQLASAFERALASDPVSAYGGIIASNKPFDPATAHAIASSFYEVVIGPGFEDAALEILGARKNLRVIETPPLAAGDQVELRWLDGAFLAQTRDTVERGLAEWTCVTARQPSPAELNDLAFAWRCVRHVKSNAIVIARDRATVGIGGGQPNRVDAVRIAVERAGDRATGSALASDAFFPFADGLEAAAAAGVTAVVQPGGSVRDREVIEAADRAGVAMLFTGERHFRH